MQSPGTVVVRTKNCDKILDQTLKVFYPQSYTDFELLIVDSGSKDQTLEIARQYPCGKTIFKAGNRYINRSITGTIYNVNN
jgi:rhamnosyltransferase